MWETTVNGKVLHFHLAGINNQNFIMRDEETGTFWQQVSGEAIFGPLKGEKLRPVVHDEVTFGLWKQEQQNGRVLKPDSSLPATKYAPANWEERMAKVPVATQSLDKTIEPRTLVVGVSLGNASKAYPLDVLAKQSPVVDEIGGAPIVLMVARDGKSVRAFESVVDGRTLEILQKTDSSDLLFVDTQTGSEWDFSGKAIRGQMSGRQLRQISVLKDYWFDWKNYHPATTIYELGNRGL